MSGHLKGENSGVQSTTSDAVIMRTILATILAVLTAIVLNSALPTPDKAHEQHSEVFKPAIAEAQPATPQATGKPIQQATPIPVPQPAAEPEPPKPQPWQVSSSPHARVSVDTINTTLAHLQAKGLSKEGAAYLTGNFIAESYLTPCGQYGDGGTAHGFGQWRFERQEGMPCGFIEQLDWAIDVEMVRDSTKGGYGCLCEALRGSDIALIKQRTKQWERWGVEGGRWQYAATIYSQL